jgi:Fe-S-cluster containining protein
MTVKFSNSLDKIKDYLQRLEVGRYDVYLSPIFFRSLSCPEKCGACCLKFSLDYITAEAQKLLWKSYPDVYREYFKFRKYNNHLILSDLQEDNIGMHCQFLDENGRCEIHNANPLSCRIEPIKFKLVRNRVYIGKQFFGRAWAMTRVDGEKGCLCSFEDYNETQYKNDLKVLQELNDAADFFGTETILPQFINLLEKLGPDVKLKNKIPIQIVGMERLDRWI